MFKALTQTAARTVNITRLASSNQLKARGSILLLQRSQMKPMSARLASQQANNADPEHELQQFLAQDIKEEKRLSKLPRNGPGVPGFEVKTDGANVLLRRTHKSEEILIKFNVNGTVDSQAPAVDEANAEQQTPEELASDMRSLPDFLVQVRKQGTAGSLVFSCSFLDPQVEEAEQPDKSDLFEIQSFAWLPAGTSIESDFDEQTYLGDGQLLDGQLYDLLMDYLDERGLGVEFAEHLIEFATYHEHGQYINLLEQVHQFFEAK